jgi:fluoroquinolone transport system permease protein
MRASLARLNETLRTDWRNVARDPLLLLVVVVPLLLAAFVRIAFPWASALTAPRLTLEPYAPFVVGYFLVLTPMLVGGASGFMLLDEREEQVLAAIAVTPLGKQGWIVYRVAVPVIATALMSLMAVYLTGLEPPPPARLLLIVVLAALEAPLATLFLAAFAANKVQAMALAKAGTLVVIAPFAALFVAAPWQYVAGVLPQFWVVKLALESRAGTLEFTELAVLAVLVHAIVLWALASTYERRAE